MKTKAGRLEPGQWVLVDGFQYFQVKEVQKHPQGDRGQVWITFLSRQGAKEIHKFWSLIEQVEVRNAEQSITNAKTASKRDRSDTGSTHSSGPGRRSASPGKKKTSSLLS